MAPLRKIVVASATLSVVAGNTAEISTSNLNGGSRAIDNLKASWGKALNIGSHRTNMKASYDYSKSKDFLKEVSFSGDLTESGDVKVGYEVTRNFGSQDTEVVLTAHASDTDLSATYSDGSLQEVGAKRDVDLGDQKVNVAPSYLVKAKTARVKMMSAIGGGSVNGQVDYNTDSGATAYEVGYDTELKKGQSLSATLTPASSDLEVELVDSTFEDGATWTANLAANLKEAGNMMDSAKLTLSRSWNW
jgi:hypothetical protein